VTRRTLTVSVAAVKTRRTDGRGLVPERAIARIAKIGTVTGTGTGTVIGIGVGVTEAAVVTVIEGAGTGETVAGLEIVVVPEIVTVETGIVTLKEGRET
jgi:hypothetical protein